MFGNELLHYGGSGGVRRGPIWQSGNVLGRRDERNFWHTISSIATGTAYRDHCKMIPAVVSRSPIANPYPWPYATTIGTDPVTGDPFLMVVAYTHAEKIDIDFFYEPDLVAYPPVEDPELPGIFRYAQLYPNGVHKNNALELITSGYPKAGDSYKTTGGCVMRIKGSFIYVNNYFSCHKYSGLHNVALPVATYTEYYDNMLTALSYPSDSDFHGSSFKAVPGLIHSMEMPTFEEVPDTQKTKCYINFWHSGSPVPDPQTTDPYDRYREARRYLHNDILRSDDAYFYEPFQMYFGPMMDEPARPANGSNFHDYMDYPRTETATDLAKRAYLESVQEQPLLTVPFFNVPRYVWSRPFGGPNDPLYSTILYPQTGEYCGIEDNNVPSTLTMTIPGSDKSEPWPGVAIASVGAASTLTENGLEPCGFYRNDDYRVSTPFPPYYTGLPNRVDRTLIAPSIEISGDSPYAFEFNALTPVIRKGEKYLCNVSPSVAGYRTSTISQTADMWSGRYKFLGFKGTISFFEKRST